MHVPQSVIEPFGVLGFPTVNISDNSRLVMTIKNGICVMVHRAIRDGYAEQHRDDECFVSDSDFRTMLENMAMIDGASEAKAITYVLHSPRVEPWGVGFYIRFRVPNNSVWHDVIIRRYWD